MIYRKFVKQQKSVRENIARMSSKPMFKVEEEVASLKQLVSLVSTGLQQNAIQIEALKKDTTQVDLARAGVITIFADIYLCNEPIIFVILFVQFFLCFLI